MGGFAVGEVGDAYAGCRARIGALVIELGGGQEGTRVPTCPEWSVHDVVAHLGGVVDDVLAGRLDGVATDSWTRAQVDARRGEPIAALVQAWDAAAPAFEHLIDGTGAPGHQAVSDVVTHEHDIRHALGQPGARDSHAVRIALGFVAPALVASAASRGIAVQLRTTDGARFGSPDAAAIVTAEPFELLRALTGRRSAAQLVAMQWDGDASCAVGAFTFGPFRPAADPIYE